MAEVDVSILTIEKVKTGLRNFKTSISGFSSKVSKDISEIIGNCKVEISKQEKIQNGLKEDKKNAQCKLSKLEGQANETARRINELQDETKSAIERSKNIDIEISKTINEKNKTIESSDGDSSPDTSYYDNKVSNLKSEKEHLISKINTCEENIEKCSSELEKLYQEIESVKNLIFELEKKLIAIAEKIEKMQKLFSSINSKGKDLSSKVKALEYGSNEIVGRSISNIDQCLDYLNEYLNS